MAAKKAQAALEYVILLAVFLIITIVALTFAGYVPNYAVNIEFRNSENFWNSQARPFLVEEANYIGQKKVAYLAVENYDAEPLVLTGIYVNGTKMSFFEYNNSYPDGVGPSYCDRSPCDGICTCQLSINARKKVQIVTQSFMSVEDICGMTGQEGKLPFMLGYSRPSPYGGNFTEKGPLQIAIRCSRQ